MKFKLTKQLFLKSAFVLILVATVTLNHNVQAVENDKADKSNDETYRQLTLFGEVFERVKQDYVEEVSDEKLIEAAINGMLVSLDPHSGYLDQDKFKNMQVQTRGEFGGLGIEVTMENGFVKVVSPIDDTPAFRAGIKPGDFITHLDDQSVLGMTLNEAVEKMRGKAGSKVKLTIGRANTEPLDVTLTRDVIRIKSVKSERYKDVGYIRITSFNEQTQEGIEKAFRDLKAGDQKDKLKGYVLDLRNNPGGLLDQAINISDDFLDGGEIVSTRGRDPNQSQRYNAEPGDLADGLPVVVLINEGSASASEIVSGALQDHHRAILLGMKSFGKGSVQTIIPMPGHGAMKLTTARYYTPSGRSIQAKGIEPDIEVPAAKVEAQAETGKSVRESDLRGALENKDTKKEATPVPAPEVAQPSPEAQPLPPKDADLAAKDYQLSRAVDLIRGLAWYRDADGKPKAVN